ncbi:MAG: hypothetical protein ACRD3S_21345, partial [Terracidiphilus sp.]
VVVPLWFFKVNGTSCRLSIGLQEDTAVHVSVSFRMRSLNALANIFLELQGEAKECVSRMGLEKTAPIITQDSSAEEK